MNPISLFIKNGCLADLHNPFDLSEIRKWLATGAHPDSIIATGCGDLSDCTPLLIVCQSHRCLNSNACDVVELLLNSGANIHQTKKSKGSTENALMLAVWAGQWTGPQAKLLELLLSRGADTNCGLAPTVNLLYSLALHDKHDCLLLFMKYGANKDRLCNQTHRRPIIPELENDQKTENYDYLNPLQTNQVGIRQAVRQKTINIIKYGFDGYQTAENSFKKSQEARELAERQARELAERLARELSERQAQEFAERQARELAERQARELAERHGREFAERQARELAERQARELAERQAQELAERQARELSERQARELAERQARELSERQARELAERQARELVERQARELAERQARELAERQARELAERQARELAERQARELAERQARELVERQARELAEKKVFEEKQRNELLMRKFNMLIQRVNQLENMLQCLDKSQISDSAGAV
jgi:hypothetical protein